MNPQITYDKQYILSLRNKVAEKTITTECNVVATFWKNLELYSEYNSDFDSSLFKSDIWKLYFEIGKGMYDSGYRQIDEVSVATYLENKPKLKEKYNSLGGYSKIEIVIDMANESNLKAHIEFLKKGNMLYSYISQMSLTEKGIDKLMALDTAEDISSFMNIKLADISKDVGKKAGRTGMINDDIDQLIAKADEGINQGLQFDSPILSDEIGGLMDGQIILVGGMSGTGKTTFTQELHLSAMWEREESTVYILNEQPKEKWQQQFLTWIINNHIIPKDHTHKFSSKRWRDGHFSAEEKEWLSKAKELLNSKIKDNLIIIEELDTYTRSNVEKLIKKYAYLGIKYFVIDTFKISADHKGDLFWFSMQEDMRAFDDLVKPANLNVNLWVTLQLEKGAVLRRYLTTNNIGMSKGVIDVASVALLMRRVRNDEYEGCKNEIKVIKPITKECLTSGEMVKLNPNKSYVLIFITKNRNGRSEEYQVVAEQNLGTLEYKEIGICDIPFEA